MKLCAIFGVCVLGLLQPAAWADGDAVAGKELAAQLREKQQSGDTYARVRLEGVSGPASSLQVQIKARNGRGGNAVVYQVLWPKERKGESALLKRSGSAVSGNTYTPPGQMQAVGAGQLKEALFGSALAWEDVIDDPLAWEQQAVVGTETVGRVPCEILESKPGKGQGSSYSSVRTWVDKRRLVPMQIEKLGAGGKVLRTIQTTRVLNDDLGKAVPATLSVRGPGGQVTQVEGGKIRHGITFAEEEFTAEGIKQTVIPKGSAE